MVGPTSHLRFKHLLPRFSFLPFSSFLLYVHLYVCTYVCMYTYIYIYIYVCVYINIYIYICEYTLSRVSSSLPVALCPSAGICFESGSLSFLSYSLCPCRFHTLKFQKKEKGKKNMWELWPGQKSVLFRVKWYETEYRGERAFSLRDHSEIVSFPFPGLNDLRQWDLF